MDLLPMFPLGSVLLPGATLPLHVFEERYRRLVRTCLDGDRTFGVVLIERGSEVGGGDVRTRVGCRAEIVQAEEQPDGRWALLAVGTERLQVADWRPDDPHPWAEVVPWPDEVPGGQESALVDAYEAAQTALRHVWLLAAQLGARLPDLTGLGDDPVAGSYQVGILGPFGPLDRQRLLATPGPAERLDLATGLLMEEAAVLEAQLGT